MVKHADKKIMNRTCPKNSESI